MARPRLLVVDDNREFTGALNRALSKEYSLCCAHSREEATRAISPPPDVVLLDLRLREDEPNNRDGVVLLSFLREQFPYIPVLVNSAYGDIDIAVECLRLGAVDFIQKPRVSIGEIKTRLSRALEEAKLRRRVMDLE